MVKSEIENARATSFVGWHVLGLALFVFPVGRKVLPTLSSGQTHRKLPQMVVLDGLACSAVNQRYHGNETHTSNGVLREGRTIVKVSLSGQVLRVERFKEAIWEDAVGGGGN